MGQVYAGLDGRLRQFIVAQPVVFGVPVTDLREERDLLVRWAERKTPEQLAAYRAEKNEAGIDGPAALG